MSVFLHHLCALRVRVADGPRFLYRTAAIRAALGASVIACLVGCGSSSTYLNGLVVERSIATSFLIQRGVDTEVLCPSRIPQRKGHSFECNVRFDAGSYAIPVIEVDGKGHVHWNTGAPVQLLDVSRVVSAIRRSVFTQRRVRSTVTCPPQVLQQQGVTFTCTASVRTGTRKVSRGTYPFTVTETDADGHVAYVGG